jgi:hypothetical protein
MVPDKFARRFVYGFVVAFSLAVVGCGGLKEGMADSQRTTAALKSELGLDAQVSFRTMNGHTVVGVKLSSAPAGDAASVKTKITDVVNRNFRAKVERVDVAF